MTTGFVDRLAAARIGDTFNQYADSELRRDAAGAVPAGTARDEDPAGRRGARLPRRTSLGDPVHVRAPAVRHAGRRRRRRRSCSRTLAELGLEDDVLLWNLVPTHPGTAESNRQPTRAEIEQSEPFLRELADGRRVVAIGRLAHARLGGPYVRHPSHGGAAAFRAGLAADAAGIGSSGGALPGPPQHDPARRDPDVALRHGPARRRGRRRSRSSSSPASRGSSASGRRSSSPPAPWPRFPPGA